MFKRLKEDIKAFRDRDPAAKSDLEIYFLYPGFKAIRMYRKANYFFRHGHTFIARLISQRAARKTGIEIHPGATIGRRLVIDHGTGIVIGETAEIGDDGGCQQSGEKIYLHGCGIGKEIREHSRGVLRRRHQPFTSDVGAIRAFRLYGRESECQSAESLFGDQRVRWRPSESSKNAVENGHYRNGL